MPVVKPPIKCENNQKNNFLILFSKIVNFQQFYGKSIYHIYIVKLQFTYRPKYRNFQEGPSKNGEKALNGNSSGQENNMMSFSKRDRDENNLNAH